MSFSKLVLVFCFLLTTLLTKAQAINHIDVFLDKKDFFYFTKDVLGKTTWEELSRRYNLSDPSYLTEFNGVSYVPNTFIRATKVRIPVIFGVNLLESNGNEDSKKVKYMRVYYYHTTNMDFRSFRSFLRNEHYDLVKRLNRLEDNSYIQDGHALCLGYIKLNLQYANASFGNNAAKSNAYPSLTNTVTNNKPRNVQGKNANNTPPDPDRSYTYRSTLENNTPNTLSNNQAPLPSSSQNFTSNENTAGGQNDDNDSKNWDPLFEEYQKKFNENATNTPSNEICSYRINPSLMQNDYNGNNQTNRHILYNGCPIGSIVKLSNTRNENMIEYAKVVGSLITSNIEDVEKGNRSIQESGCILISSFLEKNLKLNPFTKIEIACNP